MRRFGHWALFAVLLFSTFYFSSLGIIPIGLLVGWDVRKAYKYLTASPEQYTVSFKKDYDGWDYSLKCGENVMVPFDSTRYLTKSGARWSAKRAMIGDIHHARLAEVKMELTDEPLNRPIIPPSRQLTAGQTEKYRTDLERRMLHE